MKFAIYKRKSGKSVKTNIYNMELKFVETPMSVLDWKKDGQTVEFEKAGKTPDEDFLKALKNIIIVWTRKELEDNPINLAKFIAKGGFSNYIKELEANGR